MQKCPWKKTACMKDQYEMKINAVCFPTEVAKERCIWFLIFMQGILAICFIIYTYYGAQGETYIRVRYAKVPCVLNQTVMYDVALMQRRSY